MKNIIVTGTSRGIGLELVKLLAQEGHCVTAISRKTNPDLKKYSNVEMISADLSNSSEIDSIKNILLQKNKKIDVVIHNAGALINKPFEEITPAEFEYIYKVNVFGVAMLNQAVIPYMNENSHIVTISSMGGIQGSMKFAGLAAYSSSKGAVITLSELLAEEYRAQKIAFNVLALGAVQTEMLQEAFPDYKAPIEPYDMACYIKNFALTGNKYFNGRVIQVSSTTP